MIAYDTHVHSVFSTDSETPVYEQLYAALDRGMTGICLTDHMDYDFPPDQFDRELPEGEFPFLLDVEKYQEELRNIKPQFDCLEILTGVECGLQTLPDILEKNRKLTADSSFDYIIGSLHLTDRQDPYYSKFWEGKEPAGCIRQYLNELYDNLCLFTDFDSLGHLDYIVRYAPDSYEYDPAQYRELLEEILKLLIRNDIALEVNTSGFKSSSYPNPHPYILKLYRELGGEMITIGSDAHSPEFLAFEFSQIPRLLKESGLHQYVTFHGRRPRFHSLDNVSGAHLPS